MNSGHRQAGACLSQKGRGTQNSHMASHRAIRRGFLGSIQGVWQGIPIRPPIKPNKGNDHDGCGSSQFSNRSSGTHLISPANFLKPAPHHG